MFSVPVDDFITPAADDATLRLAQIMTRHGVRGCFHIVGESARVIRARSRRDVIEALAPHDIGYHSNLHSIAPLSIEHMEQTDWNRGVQRFVEDEAPGVRDVVEVFGRWPTYFTHNMTQAPQAVYGARLLGMNAVGSQTMARWPVMRYSGNLMVTHDIGFDPPKQPDDALDIAGRVDKAVAHFERLAPERDLRYPIRLFTHANKYVTWMNSDGVNFVGGATPPRSEWKLPPQRGSEASERLYAQLDELLARLVAIPGVAFVTYADIIRDLGPKEHWVAPDAISAMGVSVGAELNPVVVDGETLSSAEVFALLCRCVAGPGRAVAVRRVLGPLKPPHETATTSAIPRTQFADVCRRLDQEIDDTYAIPSAVAHDGNVYGPGAWLRAMAQVVAESPDSVSLSPGSEHPEIVKDEFFQGTDVRWRMYSKGFTGERNICAAIRCQSWSAAPA